MSGSYLTTPSPECVSHQLNFHTRHLQECDKGSSNSSIGGETVARGNSRDRAVIRWSSVERDRNDCLQVQPLEVRYSSRDGQQVTEHGHRMVCDGDAYTLVILECSPQPMEGGSADCGRSCSCDCRCACQTETELIVRQQRSGHEHLCQAHLCPQAHICHQQQVIQREQSSGSRKQFSSDESEQRKQKQEEEARQYQHQHQHQQDTQQVRNQINTDSFVNKHNQESPVNKQQLSHTVYKHNQVNRQADQTESNQQETWQQQQRRSDERLQEPSESGRASGGSQVSRGATRLVKRWNWNQAQFVDTEVPDEPAPKPQMEQSPRSQSTDIWHQDCGAYATSHQPSTSTSTSRQVRQTESAYQQQPWLANRVPDIQSVQSDPLYRDLMFELQRLEEGVAAPVEAPILESASFQKPVFGQSIRPQYVEVKEYESVEFVCRLIPISDPSMAIQWTVNGKPLQESSRITNEHEFGVVRLRIKRCEAEDSGVYQCRATNSLGEAVSSASLRVHAKGNIQCESLNPAGLDKIRQLENPKPVERVEEEVVEQAPKFLTHIADYLEKEEGDSVHFECCLAPVDDPDLRTEWFFNGRPLVTGSRFHTIDDFGFIVLDIDWLFPRDTGEYVCRASNKYGADITRTVLRVKPDKNIILDSQLDNPTIIDKLRQLEFPDVVEEVISEEPNKPAHFVQQLRSEANKRQFVEGDNVHFEARVGPADDANLSVEWFHNEKPLISGHRFKPTFDFGHIQLDILYVYAEDSGLYKCVARNAVGVAASQFEIRVAGKPSLVYQSQLPKEMVGGVQKITDMEAMWNKAPEPEEEEEPAKRAAPQFVLVPKPCVAFEGSCARFCCRVIGHPKPRMSWVVNGQSVVTGARYKLTYDGMHHLIIPKCLLSDAGRVEVCARNPLGECLAASELKVRRKVDDYRGVLKNSPKPWYDEQSLKVYQRHRSLDQDDDDEDEEELARWAQRIQMAQQQESSSPIGNQLIGYMEPGTPDVNLLARTRSPLMEPGDLHPVVAEQQVIMAPAPSTVQRAFKVKDSLGAAERNFSLQKQQVGAGSDLGGGGESTGSGREEHVYGVDLARYTSAARSAGQEQRSGRQRGQEQQQSRRELSKTLISNTNEAQRRKEPAGYQFEQQQEYRDWLTRQAEEEEEQRRMGEEERLIASLSGRQPSPAGSGHSQQQVFDARLPPPSPESVVHGKEVHSHTHKQTQLERRLNKEIKREIIEKEIFEQEHKGVTKDNAVRGSSLERRGSSLERRGSTPDSLRADSAARLAELERQRQAAVREAAEAEEVLIEEDMEPPEFVHKIQPIKAMDGDEARFECEFRGRPKPNISWFRESKMIRPSNLYSIISDLDRDRSTLIIKRVALNVNAVFTVKAENVAGSAKSSANLVVEPHPQPEGAKGGVAQSIDSGRYARESSEAAPAARESASIERDLDSSQSDSQKVVRSVKTRRLRVDEIAELSRASPEGIIAPTFLHTLHDIACRAGELARLDARLAGSQPMEVRWLKDGERVRADRSHKMVLEGDLYTLLILECQARDAGNYECLASNRVGEARCGGQLSVSADGRDASEGHAHAHTRSSSREGRAQSSEHTKATTSATAIATHKEKTHFGLSKHTYNPLMNQYTPNSPNQPTIQLAEIPKLIKGLENQIVKEGKSVTLRCQISSFPIPEVHWFKQGDKPIKPSKYFRIFKDNDETYCLKILETFPEDQGEYKCVAKAPNGQTNVETKAVITVIQ